MSRRFGYAYWNDFMPRSRPKRVKGGIKAQSGSKNFGTSWWAQQWIAVLETMPIGSRLSRGRSYARQGQVISIDVRQGEVQAEVQGSRSKPYEVIIQVKRLSDEDWAKLAEVLSGQAFFTAKLLSGEMPQDIEECFQQAGLSLFPTKSADLKTGCSCPDWSNPCKHVAAVYYLLGEEFDRDPFLIFKLRGRTREDLLNSLGASRRGPDQARSSKRRTRGKTPKARSVPEKNLTPQPAPVVPPQPINPDPSAFWSGCEIPRETISTSSATDGHAALPRRLGGFPFWRGNSPLLSILGNLYPQAAELGADILTAGQDDAESGGQDSNGSE